MTYVVKSVIDFTQDHRYSFQMEPLVGKDGQTGFHCRFIYDQQVLGSLQLYIAPAGLARDELLAYLDEIELLAVELYDIAQDQKKVAKTIQASPFAYLTQLEVHPNHQDTGIGSFMLDHVCLLLKNFHIPNLYLVSVADTKRTQQKLHHFYTHHYFTYLVPTHPDKPAVMHRAIEI